MTYNFEGFNNRNNGNGTPTEGQIATYIKLCMQKSVEFNEKELIKKSSEEVSEAIQQLLKYNPATPNQKKGIQWRIKKLQDAGDDIKQFDEETLNKMTYEEANSTIKKLEEMLEVAKDNLPPNESQLKRLAHMYPCVGCDFEGEYGIQRKIELGGGQWRYMTPEEFVKECTDKMSYRQASHFLDKYREVYQEYRSTRCTSGMMKYIRELEGRLMTINANTITSIDENGEKQNIRIGSEDVYTPLHKIQLLMMDKDSASEYIEMLKNDLARRNVSTNIEGDLTFENLRQQAGEFQRKKLRFDNIIDCLHKLQAIGGWEVPEVIESVEWLILEDVDTPQLIEKKEIIRSYLMKLYRDGYIGYANLAEICEKADTVLLEILTGEYTETA